MTTISYKDIDIDDLEFNTPERLGNSYICNLYHNDNYDTLKGMIILQSLAQFVKL